MIAFNPENADYFHLSHRETLIVALIEKGHNRAAIADQLGIAKQTIRDMIGDLCEDYGCPTHKLPERIREEAALVFSQSEISS